MIGYKCEICGKILIKRKAMRKHIQNDHKHLVREDYNFLYKTDKNVDKNNQLSRYYVRISKQDGQWVEIPSAQKMRYNQQGVRT